LLDPKWPDPSPDSAQAGARYVRLPFKTFLNETHAWARSQKRQTFLIKHVPGHVLEKEFARQIVNVPSQYNSVLLNTFLNLACFP
jgi:hypothetical protein